MKPAMRLCFAPLQCDECGGYLIEKDHDLLCARCGLVYDDAPINFGSEFNVRDPDRADRLRRTGQPINWLNPDWSTTFYPKGKGRWQKYR